MTGFRKMTTGADGYFIDEGRHVYCLLEALEMRMQQVDYFHGLYQGVPVCQTMVGKINLSSSSMISTSIFNPTVRRITKIQRKFRSRYSGQDFQDPRTGMIWRYLPSGEWYHRDTEWIMYQDPRTECPWYHQASSGRALWMQNGLQAKCVMGKNCPEWF